jgi:carbonic anhydrase
MRLFEAIIDANHRAIAGDATAGLCPSDFADELPVIALTCVDPRLNSLFPSALALPAEQFIWLRNAGNLITGTLSSTMRSLALACAVKGGREIAIIGHTDCQVAKTTTMGLLEKLKALGVDRSRLPDNVNEFFGTFGSERQNVIKACDFARQSPLIGPKIPVHGLMVDVVTGKLDWVVNGYETLATQPHHDAVKPAFATMDAIGTFKNFDAGEMKFPEMKIGEAATRAHAAHQPPPAPTSSTPTARPMIVVPPALPSSPAPPPLKKSPLPPIRIAPPLNPRKDFRRG